VTGRLKLETVTSRLGVGFDVEGMYCIFVVGISGDCSDVQVQLIGLADMGCR